MSFDGDASEFFTWGEILGSTTAARLGIDNTPANESVTQRLLRTAASMDQVRKVLGHPVAVTSWYRCLELNRAIGSKDTSMHVTGAAVDFRCPGFGSTQQVFDYLRTAMYGLDIDQLIHEYPDSPGSWVHVGFAVTPRFQALVIDASGTHVV